MIFDINTATGHWPFRKVRNEGISELNRLLKRQGISGAAVVNTHGLFYNNCQDANIELAHAISKQNDFFAGVATLNPLYPAWDRDLSCCVEQLGMKALRLAPQYHNYHLQDPPAKEIAEAATSLRLPILIPVRLVDIRGRNWMDTERMVGLEEAGRLSLDVPKSRIIITECQVLPASLLKEDESPKYPGLYFEMSRMRSAYGQPIAALVKAVGAEHVLFGSGAPFKEITPAVLKLQAIKCSEKTRSQIAYRNARKLLRI